MSNRGDFVGTAPDSGIYVPSPTPAEQEDLPVYINDELLRVGGIVNGVLEGGALPPHSKLPKRYKEGMIMNFSKDVGDGVDSSGVWLYKNSKWWKLIDDPTTITDEIYEKIAEVEKEISDAEADIKNLNEVILPQVQADLAQANADLTQANKDLATLEGMFPIGSTDIKDDSISTPKLQTNSVNADKILANSITANKIKANAVTADKIVANAITADKIASNSISSDKIVANTITGAKISSTTTITAGSGNDVAKLDGSNATWRVYAGNSNPANAPFRVDKDGNLFAETGTFGGTIYAEKVSGDFTDTITKKFDTDNHITWTDKDGSPNIVKPIDIFTVKISKAKPYTRMVRVDPIRFDMNNGSGSQWYHILVYRQYLNTVTGIPEGPEQQIVGNYEAAWAVYDDPQRKFNASPAVFFEILPNLAASYRIAIGIEHNTTGGSTLKQTAAVTLFKQGTELSFI